MRLLLLTVLLGLLLLTWWALQPLSGPSGETRPGKREEVVDYFVSGLDLTTYDAGGAPLRRLQAAHLEHFRDSGDTRLAAPRFLLFEKDRILWNIRSESGTLSQDQSLLRLHGEVEVQRSATEALPAIRLQTRDMLVKPDEEYAETEAPVTITSQANWIKAVGMQAWLRSPGKIHFMANTRAYYVAE